MILKKEFKKLEPVKELLEKLGYKNVVIDIQFGTFRTEIQIDAERDKNLSHDETN